MKSRVIWLDSLKGILTILVVLGHCIAQVFGNDVANNNFWWCLIYSFHMPAFMAVSGYLQYNPHSTAKMALAGQLCRRFNQLLIPFLAWSAIFFAVRGRIEWFYSCIILPNSTFWFLWALFYISFVFLILQDLSKKYKVNLDYILVATCVTFAGILVALKDIHFLGIQYVLYYFIFYIMGYYIHKLEIWTDKVVVIIILIAQWFLLASFWRPNALPDFIPLTGNAATLLRFVYKFVVAAVAVVAIFSIAPGKLNSDKTVGRILAWLGKYSLGVYVIHLTFVDIVNTIVRGFVSLDWLRILILSIVLLFLSYVQVWMLNKNRWTARILLGKF